MVHQAKEFIPIVKGTIDRLLSFLGDEIKQVVTNRLIEYQCEEYKRNLFTKTILHRAEPKRLDEFYQPLYITPQKGSNKVRDVTRISTESVSEFFDLAKCITLIGSAGSGKSTLLKYLSVKCISEDFKIPIKIELRYLNSSADSNIHNYITESIFQFQRLGITSDKINQLLEKDYFVFFFDGYDELSSSIRAKVSNDIDSFIKRYPNNNYVITSRPYTDIELLPLFKNYTISNLSDEEISLFIKKQISNDEKELTEKLIKAIRTPENIGYRSFLSNPLLLSMFILTFQSYSEVPHKRSEFYNQVFDTLFSTHDSMSKLAYVREKRSNLSKEQFEEVLKIFSSISFFEDQFSFPQSYINEKLNYIKERKSNLKFENTLLIDDLQIAIGILNKEGSDYSFPHRSLQEYFAAYYVSQLNLTNKKILYTKMMKPILLNTGDLMFKAHFFSLLTELDFPNILRDFIIPILENAYSQLNGKSRSTNGELIFYFISVYLAMNVSNNIRFLFSDIYCEYFEEFKGGIHVLIISKSEISKFKKYHNGMIREGEDLLITKGKLYKKRGQILIDKLNDYLLEIDKSDTDIINTLL